MPRGLQYVTGVHANLCPLSELYRRESNLRTPFSFWDFYVSIYGAACLIVQI